MFRNASSSSRRVLSRAAHAVMEPMDARQLYSATLINSGLLAGTLVIDGTSKSDKIDLSLRHRSDGLYVNVAEQGKSPARFKSGQVKMVIANLGKGDDQFDGRAIAQPMVVHAGDGRDYVLAGKGNDTLNGNAGNDYLHGMEGEDVLTGQDGNDTLAGGANNDTMIGQAGADSFQGNSGFDTVDYRQHATPVNVKIDYLSNDGSTGEGDFIAGDVENVIGTKFNDYMLGDNYTQTFSGMQGHDTLNGGGGNDSLYGGEGNDLLQGGEGNDYLEGSSGADVIRGGNGTDSVELKRAPAAVRISLDNVANDGRADGNDNRAGKPADDYGSDTEVVYGTEFADIIVGSSADNVIYGMGGNDSLNGGHGNDKIYGGAGDDNLYGDEGLDTLSGEAGNDGLYGGREWADKLYGGEGRDRFLTHVIKTGGVNKAEDVVSDKVFGDTVIKFWDNYSATNLRLAGMTKYEQSLSFQPTWWKENDVERVDAVLSGVSHVGNGARILSYDSRDLNYFRTGTQTQGLNKDTFSLDKHIAVFTDRAFDSGTERLRKAVTNAVGLDLALEYADLFASDLGWRRYEDLTGQDIHRYHSGEAGWVYSSGSQFVNNEAKTRPTYDFVETFQKVVHDDNGWAHHYNNAPGKELWFDNYPLKYLRM